MNNEYCSGGHFPVPQDEDLLSLREARACVSDVKRFDLSTLHRWIAKGVLSADGARIRLRARRIGRQWFTSEHAIREFIDRLNPGDNPPERHPSSAPIDRNRASVDARLRAAGIRKD